jgi:hypothetical protein
VSRLFLLLLVLAATGCASHPEPPRLSPELDERVRNVPSPHFRALLECDETEDVYSATCDESLAKMRRLLSASPWFDTLDAPRAEADLLLLVRRVELTPYWHYPTHSLGALIVALVIPLGWIERAGYQLTAVVPESGAALEIDTRRDSRAFVWILAPLLNLSPERAFRPSAQRELDLIHAQLLPIAESKR